MSERELVRCSCGLVRSLDEDPLLVAVFWKVMPAPEMELPRVCRGCRVIYALPKPKEPS